MAIGMLFWTIQGAGAEGKLCLDIADHCKATSVFSQGVCVGYLEGLADTKTEGVCLPEGVTPKAIQGSFLKWVETHPQARLNPAPDCYRAAMVSAYPCN